METLDETGKKREHVHFTDRTALSFFRVPSDLTLFYHGGEVTVSCMKTMMHIPLLVEMRVPDLIMNFL